MDVLLLVLYVKIVAYQREGSESAMSSRMCV